MDASKRGRNVAIKLDIYIYICIYTLDCYPLKLTRISYFGGRSICGSLDCDIGSVT